MAADGTLAVTTAAGAGSGRATSLQRFARRRSTIAFLMTLVGLSPALGTFFAGVVLANSEFLVLLNQSATDREELAKLLNISDTQLGYITNVPAGCGLIRCAGSIVPFTNSFPKNTRLYQLMTTKPDEALR